MSGQSHPLISIITPMYNVAPYLAQCIESVLGQTYPHWELILVDDGSADETAAIAGSFAGRFPDRIRHVEHPGRANRGASASRNLGRTRAGGEYIAYLDADDLWLPTRLSDQAEILRRHPDTGMILGATRYWYGWTGRPGDEARDEIIPVGGLQDQITQPPGLVEALYPLGRGAAPSMNTVLVRTGLVDRVGGWEDGFRVAFTDQAFLVKLYLVAPVYISSAVWDLYRQRPDSSMHTALAGAGYDEHRQRFLTWLEGYLRRQDLAGTQAWKALRRAQRPYRRPGLHRAIRLGRRVAGRLASAVSAG